MRWALCAWHSRAERNEWTEMSVATDDVGEGKLTSVSLSEPGPPAVTSVSVSESAHHVTYTTDTALHKGYRHNWMILAIEY
ncbi:hypothetical protein J6590_002933 [Homalodisca vitripennis]|nr:hypothetical protein J6590_002933 [Homalodisca vitripennis]